MKNKYLKSSVFLVAPAIIGGTLPGNVSNALSAGEAWEYIKSALLPLWAKMKFWETKEEDLNSNVEHENSLLNLKGLSDAKEPSPPEKCDFIYMDKDKLKFLKDGFNLDSANKSGEPKPNVASNRTLQLQGINTVNRVIRYKVFDYNSYRVSDATYCYGLFTFNNNEKYVYFDNWSTGMRGNRILFSRNKPNELWVFYAQGGGTLYDFSNKSQVKKIDFDSSGKAVPAQILSGVPHIVKEIETVILWIKEKDKVFYSQFEPAANNMGGFQANNMQGAQNNNIINS